MTTPDAPSPLTLTLAVRKGQLETIRAAHEAGMQQTLLEVARAEGSFEVLRFLVELGAAPELADSPLVRIPGLAKAVEAFVGAFEKGKPKGSRADVEAWLLDGDAEALERLSRTKLKAGGLRTLEFALLKTDDTESRARCLALLKGSLGEEALLDWIAQRGAAWLDTYRVCETGGEVRHREGYEDQKNQCALQELAERLRGEPRFGALFRALSNKPTYRFQAWTLAGAIGAAERDDGGKTRRAIRWIDEVAIVRERNKYAVHVFDDPAELEAFVSVAPDVEQAVVRGGLKQIDGYVSVFVDATLDPKGTGDGRGGPLGWFDHDYHEATSGTAEVLRRFSRAETFADAAIAKATDFGLEGTHRFEALFDHHYAGVPGRAKFGWFLGSFPARRPA